MKLSTSHQTADGLSRIVLMSGLSVFALGREASEYSPRGETSQGGSCQRQQAPHSRRLQEDPSGAAGQGGQWCAGQGPEEEERGQ